MPLFQKIAGQPNFYGNLTDDEPERLITVPPQAAPLTRGGKDCRRCQPGAALALALLRLDLRVEGRARVELDPARHERPPAARRRRPARRNDVHDRAIAAADRTKNEHDYSLRYLAPYNDQVMAGGGKAVARRCLGLWSDAAGKAASSPAPSTVGASGLMQLMPATARWVAKKIGLANYSHSRERHRDQPPARHFVHAAGDGPRQSPVLASAAYNAGPGVPQVARRRTAGRRHLRRNHPFNETRG